MNKHVAGVVAGVAVVLSLVANAVMAEEAGAGKPRKEFKRPVTVFILARQSNMEGLGGKRSLASTSITGTAITREVPGCTPWLAIVWPRQ